MLDFTKLIKNSLISVTLLFGASSAFAGNLTIEINDIRNTKGKLQVAVYNQEQAYKKNSLDKAYAAFSLSVNSKRNAITLRDIPKGKYAVSLFHDENSNGQMETNVANMPKEGYGTSNADDKYDELSFSQASVQVSDKNRIVKVKMFYMGEK